MDCAFGVNVKNIYVALDPEDCFPFFFLKVSQFYIVHRITLYVMSYLLCNMRDLG